MRALDRLVAAFAPQAALRRVQARRALAYYEAAEPTTTRKRPLRDLPINDLVERSTPQLLAQVRSLERNHDLARGALGTLVNNTIGPSGIGIEPQPRRADGSIHEDYAKTLREVYADWAQHPEVTGRFTWAQSQRLLARAWFRDGEAFAKDIIGTQPGLRSAARVPYALELLECDNCPVGHEDLHRAVRQGIELDAWGRPRAYWMHRLDLRNHWTIATSRDLVRVPAERMVHLAMIDRIHQLRGVSAFASVLARLGDIKEYEDSERIAAKVAAMLTAYIKKGGPAEFNPHGHPIDAATGKPVNREIRLQPGMLIDGLQPGEELGMLDSNRPNPNLVAFRQGQLRAVAAGLGASYSSIARDYDGTYSAQRQELVEQWVHYAVLTDEFAGQVIQPTWSTFVEVAHLSGVARRPADVPEHAANDALYLGQSMPWIDPLKEANAWRELVRAGFASEVEVMRRRGVNPADVLEQIRKHRAQTAEYGLQFSSDAAHDHGSPTPAREPDDQELADAVAAVLRRSA